MLNELRRMDPEIYEAVRDEVRRQQVQIELIASENYVSQAVLEAQGSVMTNKYAEGYPAARYYAGCEYVDVAERLAVERAKRIFAAEHANVQPHSGTQANMAAYFALLEPGDRILSMSLAMGGHLSHGANGNFSGRVYDVRQYGVSRETEQIDLEEVRRIAEEFRPKLIIVGASAYPRALDFEGFGRIARDVGSLLMADIAHIAGPVAAGLHPDPIPHCDVVTATTHKTMRGPRGGIILSRAKHGKGIDAQVFPGMQGGPLMHVIAAKAVALKEALAPDFHQYQEKLLANSKTLAADLASRGFRLVAGGTDNHMMLVDVQKSRGLTGTQATLVLDEVGITINKNPIPFDEPSPARWKGVRLGTPACTTRGMGPEEMKQMAGIIDRALSNPGDRVLHKRLRDESLDLCDRFPIYAGLLRRLYEQDHGAYDVAETGGAGPAQQSLL
jgi:glycine hydroxymethyltransferase